MSTARFSKVVEQSGKPEPYTLWSDPKEDPEFQKALKAQRVMTVHQDAVGSKTDYGTVGYTGDPSATFLLFPKSLAPFEGKRVIGIKYDLLDARPKARGGKVKLPKKPVEPAKPKATRRPELTNIIPFITRGEEAKEADPPSTSARKQRAKKADKEAKKPKLAKHKSEAKPKRTKPGKPKLEAAEEGKQKAESRKREDVSASPPEKAPSPAELRREILKAMKALKAGKAVVAYETLDALRTRLADTDHP